MKSALSTSGPRLSIVIPNARPFPAALVGRLVRQAQVGEEVIVVRNHPRSAPRRWVGIGATSNGFDSAAPQAAPSSVSGVSVTVRRSSEGAAAARNEGWRNAHNDSILFLDDDVEISDSFLLQVRQWLVRGSTASLLTFRTQSASKSRWSSLVANTISLDRGPGLRSTEGRWLGLEDAWMYGAGAAMLADRNLLETTGGFKDHLGAGRINGGTEDTEFIWHASRHATVEYHGVIAVAHRDMRRLSSILRKMREYGRAIGNLGGLAKDFRGCRYVLGYCLHLKSSARLEWAANRGVPSLLRFKVAVGAAIDETLKAYALSLDHGTSSSILCKNCRGACL